MEQLEQFYNFDKYTSCRACLVNLSDMENHYDIFAIPDLQQKFTLCTSLPLEPGDGFPTNLCETCSTKIGEFCTFKEMCISSRNQFQDYINSDRKPCSTELSIVPNNLLLLTDTKKENEDEDPISLDQFSGLVKKELLIDDEEEDSEESQSYVESKQKEQGTFINDNNENDNKEIFNETTSSVEKKKTKNVLGKMNLECKTCNKSFKKTETLQRHIVSVHKGLNPFRCHLCDKSYARHHRLKLHIKQIHDGIKETFPCIECDKILSTKDNLRQHIRDAHWHIQCEQNLIDNAKNESIELKENEETIDDSINPVRDENTNKLSTKTKFKCEICKKLLKSNETLERHIRVHKGLQPFTCHLCDRSYNRRSRLLLHIKNIHEGIPNEKIPCTVPECNRLLKSKQTLRQHIKDMHCNNVRKPRQPYVCEECGKVLTSRTTLQNHLYLHTGQELPHECPQCNKRFLKKCKLKEHMMRHAGIRNYICPVCGAKKTTRNELKKHIEFHNREKKFPCQMCDMAFYNVWSYNRHKRIVHEGVKNYKCSYCDLSFGKSETRKHHEMTHTGEKPHECDVCQKKFIQYTALKKHKQVHLKQLQGHSNQN